jgi:hypothetical protein
LAAFITISIAKYPWDLPFFLKKNAIRDLDHPSKMCIPIVDRTVFSIRNERYIREEGTPSMQQERAHDNKKEALRMRTVRKP